MTDVEPLLRLIVFAASARLLIFIARHLIKKWQKGR